MGEILCKRGRGEQHIHMYNIHHLIKHTHLYKCIYSQPPVWQTWWKKSLSSTLFVLKYKCVSTNNYTWKHQQEGGTLWMLLGTQLNMTTTTNTSRHLLSWQIWCIILLAWNIYVDKCPSTHDLFHCWTSQEVGPHCIYIYGKIQDKHSQQLSTAV